MMANDHPPFIDFVFIETALIFWILQPCLIPQRATFTSFSMQKTSWLYGYGSIPINTILMGWTSIYQLFWCSPGVQGFDTLPYIPFLIALNHHFQRVKNPHVPTIDPAPGSSLQRKINEVLVNSREFLGCTVGHLRRWRNHWNWRFNGIWTWGIQWDLSYY